MKYTHTGPRAQQQGFTLVELGISMVLIASMVLAGFYVVKRIRTDAAINAAIASANVSMNKANAAFSGSDSTDGANMTTLAAMNVWPKERHIISENKSGTGPNAVVLSRTVTNIKGHFSGSEEMMWADGANSTPANSGFIYHLWRVPQEACLPLIKNMALHPTTRSILAGAHSSTRPVAGFGVGKTAVKTGTGALNLAAAAQACMKDQRVDIAVQFDKS